MKTTLTPQESAQLIELGVDAKLASCEQYAETGEMRGGIELPPVAKPVFRLTDILARLPKEIGKYWLEISVTDEYSIVQYVAMRREKLHWIMESELIDALYRLLIWCINNGHYKS